MLYTCVGDGSSTNHVICTCSPHFWRINALSEGNNGGRLEIWLAYELMGHEARLFYRCNLFHASMSNMSHMLYGNNIACNLEIIIL